MIPKVIHYCWFGGNPLPGDVKKCIASWKKYCPEYEIKRWDESNFDVNCHPFVKAAYEAKVWAFVSDYARLKVVYENGGIYLDTDVELIKSLDALLKNPCYIGIQYNGYLCNTGLGFGAVKFSPVVHTMMEKYNSIAFSIDKRNDFACPLLNNDVICTLGYKKSNDPVHLKDVTVYPPRYFDPYPSGVSENLMTSETISIHHYSATWTNGTQRFKRKLVRALGVNRVIAIKKRLGMK